MTAWATAEGLTLGRVVTSEVDDVARDMTEILTSLCGRHATANRAARAVEAITGNVP